MDAQGKSVGDLLGTGHPLGLIGGAARPSLSYTTTLGAQFAGDSLALIPLIESESVDLIVTSPPFALLRSKSYGNRDQAEYVDWLTQFGRLARRVLKETGSLVMDLGGAYVRGQPVRSLYNYRVLLEFCDSLGYQLAEEFFWHNPSKLPSPVEWVNKRKIRVKDSVNPVWWLSKSMDPKADASRVRVDYSARMRALLVDPDKYYRPGIRPSEHRISRSFHRDNGGALPSNLLSLPNTESGSAYLRNCRLLGQSAHPARFPPDLPRFFIRFLTDPNDVVLDFFSGSNTTGWAAEAEGRRWLAIEMVQEYATGSAIRFIAGMGDTEKLALWDRMMSGERFHISDVGAYRLD